MNEKVERGDIIFIPEYKYPNGKKGAEHLFVVFDSINEPEQLSAYMLPSLDIFVDLYLDFELSSTQKKARENSDNPNFQYNLTITDDISITNLHRDSHVKLDQFYLFSQEKLNRKLKDNDVFKIGKVSEKQLKKIEELVKKCILERSHVYSFNL